MRNLSAALHPFTVQHPPTAPRWRSVSRSALAPRPLRTRLVAAEEEAPAAKKPRAPKAAPTSLKAKQATTKTPTKAKAKKATKKEDNRHQGGHGQTKSAPPSRRVAAIGLVDREGQPKARSRPRSSGYSKHGHRRHRRRLLVYTSSGSYILRETYSIRAETERSPKTRM